MTLSTRKWTRAEYERLTQVDVLAEDERVELIRGDIVEMSPIDPKHAQAVDEATMLFTAEFRDTHVVRVQNPLLVGDDSEPQPDLVLIPREMARELVRRGEHPAAADLVLEISHSSLAYDRNQKGSLYASSGFPLYAIVNLVDGWLELYRDPVPDLAALYGWRYAASQRVLPGQSFSVAGRTLPVSGLLPQGEPDASNLQ